MELVHGKEEGQGMSLFLVVLQTRTDGFREQLPQQTFFLMIYNS